MKKRGRYSSESRPAGKSTNTAQVAKPGGTIRAAADGGDDLPAGRPSEHRLYRRMPSRERLTILHSR